MAYNNFFARFGDPEQAGTQAPAQPAPAPVSQAPAQPETLAPDKNQAFFNRFGNQAQDFEVGNPIQGTSPTNAVDVSPLSLFERAQLGWVRTPDEQEKLLKQKFDSVQRVQTQDGVHFAVEKDGTWHQADPAFEWKVSPSGAMAGAAAGVTGGIGGMALGAITGGLAVPTLANKNNLKNMAGSFAQATGEYGLRAAAAASAGEAGMAGGMAAGAAFGPLGVAAGGAIGGLTSAALGSAGADATDLATRSLVMDKNTPGAQPYHTPDEINQQMLASAMFGAESFTAGKAMEWGAKAVSQKFAQIINGYMDTPEGHQSAQKLLGILGAKPAEVEERLQNPQRNAYYDRLMAQDIASPDPKRLGLLDQAQESATDDLHDAIKAVARKEGAELGALAQLPKVKNRQFDLTGVFQDAKSALNDAGLLNNEGQINPNRVLGDGDKEAIRLILSNQPKQVTTILNRAPKGSVADAASMDANQYVDALFKRTPAAGSTRVTTIGKIADYQDARAIVQDVGSVLNKGVFNENLKRILVGMKDNANNIIIDGLEDAKDGAGQAYGQILAKYATAKAVNEDLSSLTSGNKRFALAKRLLSEEPTQAKATADGLIQAGVDPDLISKLIQMQGSRNSARWFTGAKFDAPFVGKRIPNPGPRAAASLINAGSEAKDTLSQVGRGLQQTDVVRKMLPYTNKAIQMMKQLPPDQLKEVLMDPRALDTIGGIIGGSAMQEKQTRDQLLQSVGITGGQ